FAAMLASGVASAQATVGQVQEAQDRYQEGRRLFGDGHYAEAHMKFEQACAVQRTVNCPKNLGLAEFEMGRYAEAASHLRDFLREARTVGGAGLDEAQTAKIRKMYDDAFAKSAHVQVTAPADARIVVDDRVVGNAPLADAVDVAVGAHVVEARTGRGVLRQKVSLTAGEVVPIHFVEQSEGYPAPVVADRPGASSARTVTLVSLYAVAVVGAGVGITLLLHAQARGNDADGIRAHLPADNACNGTAFGDPQGSCSQLHALRDTYDNDHKWATVSFIGAGVFAAAATTAFFLWPLQKQERAEEKAAGSARLVPWIAPGGGGAGLSGHF
ncbi:MAG TPA: hypothetical protein VNO21_09420, partial [Polyangiaceae bacterium]|nr:hypothetical protein [Polyangiaceae bacterium]